MGNTNNVSVHHSQAVGLYKKQAELENSNNPFGVVTLAHLQAKKTKNKPEDRYRVKLHLIRGLYKKGFTKQQVVDIFRFIDWVLRLPEEADNQLWKEIVDFEENKKMPYITSVERIGEQKGLQKGKAEMLSSLLQHRFKNIPTWTHDKISKADVPTLEAWSLRFVNAQSLEDVFGDSSNV